MPVKSKYRRVYIEITNVCNLSCEFCPAGNNTYKQRSAIYMELRDFEHILVQIKPVAGEIYLHVTGEPLMHPKLDKILLLCEKYDICVNITTNGVLLADTAEVLTNAQKLRTINISMHSFTGNKDELDKYVNDIVKFIRKLLEESDATCKLRIWNLEQSEIQKFIFRKLEEEFELPFMLTNRMTQLEGIRLAKRVFLSQSEQFAWPNLDGKEYSGNAYCLGLRNQFAILADGRVVPCCLDGEGIMEIGNIFKNNIADILCSERAVNIYEGFSSRIANEDFCKKCGYRLKFN